VESSDALIDQAEDFGHVHHAVKLPPGTFISER
jgi:hypothetical protein